MPAGITNAIVLQTGEKPSEGQEYMRLALFDESGQPLNLIGGEQGPIGPQGPEGAVGPRGPQGFQGVSGSTGSPGPKGDTGAQGAQGPSGPKGDTGGTGGAGPTGPAGVTGAQGLQGVKGDTGNTGPAGIQGPAGPKGDKGDKGDTGNTGGIGLTGPQGAQGIQGPAGSAGSVTMLVPADLPTYIPTDGERAVIKISETVFWDLIYNEEAPPPYKWCVLGGPSLENEIVTSANETTNSTSYTALGTTGPTIQLPTAGLFDVDISMHCWHSVLNGLCAMSYEIGASLAADADSASAFAPAAGNGGFVIRRERRKTFGTGALLVAKYRTSGATMTVAGTAAPAPGAHRRMKATPIRIG